MDPATSYLDYLPPEIHERINWILKNQPFDFEGLPVELQRHIAVFMPYEALLRLCTTSSEVNENICGDDFFWYTKTLEDYGNLKILKGVSAPFGDILLRGDDWRGTYMLYRDKAADLAMRYIDNGIFTEATELIDSGLVNVNYVDVDGNDDTLLFLAILYEHLEILRKLLELGADPNQFFDASASYAIQYAVERKPVHTEMVLDLLNYGAEIPPESGDESDGDWSVLAKAAYKGNEDLVRHFLDMGMDPNGKYSRMSSLQWASGEGHANIVRMLIEAGVNITRSALILAYEQDREDVIEILIEAGVEELSEEEIHRIEQDQYYSV